MIDPAEYPPSNLPEAPAITSESTTRNVARNTLIMFGAQILTFGLTFIWTVVIQHKLGDANVGRLFTAQSLAWIGMVFMDAGVATYLAKQVARERGNTTRLLGTAYALRAISTMVVYAAILCIAHILGYDGATQIAAVLVGASVMAGSFTQATAAGFQGHEEMKWPALGNIAEKLTITTVTVILLFAGYGLLAVASVMLVGALANLAVVGILAWRRGWVKIQFNFPLMKSLLAGGAPFFLWASFGVIYQRNSALQLAALTDPATTGHFGAATRMYETLSFVLYIFQTAVLPVLSRTFVQSTDQMQRTARRSFELIIMAALPIGAGVTLLSPQIIDLVTERSQFVGSIVPLRILGISLLPLYVDMILAMILISVDKQKQWGYVAVFAAVINPVLNWLLITWTDARYHNGAIGAAIVTLFTEVMIFFFYIFLIPRDILNRGTVITAGKFIVATAGMGLSLWLMLPVFNAYSPNGGTGKVGAAAVLIMSSVGGACIYLGLAWLLRAVGADDIRLLRKALTRGR